MSSYLDKLYSEITPERKRRFEYADRISDYLRNKLSQRDMSQKDFAEKMDMSPPQLSRYMNGEANLNLETIAKLEIALDDRIIMVKEPLASVKQKVKYEGTKADAVNAAMYSIGKKERQKTVETSYKENKYAETGS